MKVSKTMLLVIAIGIGALVLGVLAMMRSGMSQQQTELSQKLAKTQSQLKLVQLEPITAKREQLEKQMSEATAKLTAVKSMFSQPVSELTITNELVDTATKVYGLKVNEVSSSGVVSATVEGVPCSVITLTAKVEGDVPSLALFVTKLNSAFATGVVKSVTMTAPEKTTGDNVTADNMTAAIQLAVYTPR